VADVASAEKVLRRLHDLDATARKQGPAPSGQAFASVPGATPIAELRYRQPATVAGRIRSVRVHPGFDTPALEATLTDASGGELLAVFLGRKEIPGIRTGTQIVLTGTVGDRRGRLAMLNPAYELLSVPDTEPGPAA
jgi:hypothetical protein